MYNMYHQNGVIITPNVLTEGDRATVSYKGILCNSGADTVYMHAGYGDKWTNLTDVEMKKVSEGFEAVIPIAGNKKLSLAFKDSANNWDNNSGRNYSFEITEARRVKL